MPGNERYEMNGGGACGCRLWPASFEGASPIMLNRLAKLGVIGIVVVCIRGRLIASPKPVLFATDVSSDSNEAG